MAEEASVKEERDVRDEEKYEDLEEQDTEETSSATDETSEKVERLKDEVEEKEETIKELRKRIQHLQADFENYKKRQKKETKQAKYEAAGDVILDIVTVYDNLDRAFKSFEKNDDTESFIEGIERIYAQFTEILSKRDVEPIEAEGEKFDPKKHQALMKVEVDDEGHNTITEEFERGYTYKGNVLKPSKVKVNLNPDDKGK